MGELSFKGDLDKLMPILEAKFVNLDAGVGSHGKTALYQAALGGQRATMEKLIEFGANIEARNPVSGLVWWWS